MRVVLTSRAARDLAHLLDYLTQKAGDKVAADTLDRIERRCGELADLPDRGNVVPELSALGIRDYRKLHERPYRTIYRMVRDEVIVYVIADARRDFRSLLEQRLLR